MLTSLGFCFKEGNFYRILLSFHGQWEKTLPSLRSLKRRVASLTSSKSYQVHACQIKVPRINSYYFLNQSFYFTIFCLVVIVQKYYAFVQYRYRTIISYCNTLFFTNEMKDLVLSLTYHQLLC